MRAEFKKKLTVSIGIPAYNEEANIQKLLLSLLNQKGNHLTLKEIIVVSDKSTDNTVEEVKSIPSKIITLIQNKRRSGQAVGQNKIIQLFTGEVLILLNADVLPSGDKFISHLVSPFDSDADLGPAVPKFIPLKASNLFESLINYSIDFKDSVFETWNKGNNLYSCNGRARAFKREFAKQIHWPSSLSEDAFSYLLCLKKGYKFAYVPSAKLIFKSPNNFADHVRQSARFTSGPTIMSKYFDNKFVNAEYSLPKSIALQTAIEYFIKNPILFFLYLITFFAIKISPFKSNYAKTKWQMSVSSKKLSMT